MKLTTDHDFHLSRGDDRAESDTLDGFIFDWDLMAVVEYRDGVLVGPGVVEALEG